MIYNYTTLLSGEIRGSQISEELPDVACALVKFKARSNNSGNVYIGYTSNTAGLTVPEGNNDTTSGFELSPGDDSGWIPIDNLNRFQRICDNNGDNLTYLVLR